MLIVSHTLAVKRSHQHASEMTWSARIARNPGTYNDVTVTAIRVMLSILRLTGSNLVIRRYCMMKWYVSHRWQFSGTCWWCSHPQMYQMLLKWHWRWPCCRFRQFWWPHGHADQWFWLRSSMGLSISVL